MKLIKKIWFDENSQPPKNWLWAKGGKLFKNIDGQWKEISKKESEEQGEQEQEEEQETANKNLLSFFPCPSKIVGVIDENDGSDVEAIPWIGDGRTVQINRDIIALDDLGSYIENADFSGSNSKTFTFIYEYDPKYDMYNEESFSVEEPHLSQILSSITVSYNAQYKTVEINDISYYSAVVKARKDDKEYLAGIFVNDD